MWNKIITEVVKMKIIIIKYDNKIYPYIIYLALPVEYSNSLCSARRICGTDCSCFSVRLPLWQLWAQVDVLYLRSPRVKKLKAILVMGFV